MLTCASRLNTQPQWTHSSAFVRQREGEFRIGGVAQDLYPKAFILPPSDTPVTGDCRENPAAGLKVSVSLPLSTTCHFQPI
jgi:hypothetical protein